MRSVSDGFVMFETLGIENLNSSSASFYFGLVLGGLFGYSAKKLNSVFGEH